MKTEQNPATQPARVNEEAASLSNSRLTQIRPRVDIEKMQRLLEPRSVAVIGASEQCGTVGNEVLNNIISGGFTGAIYPVNPKYAGVERPETAGGTKISYKASAEDLPDGAVDMALVMTPAKTVPQIIDRLGEKGVKAVVLISAGFGETGPEGKALENELRRVVEKHEIVLVGPNCVGITNGAADINLNATFVKGKAAPGSGALVSQSGAVGIDIMNRAARMGVGISQFTSIGNALKIDAGEMLEYWRNRPDVKYIVGYVESIPDVNEFRTVAKEITKDKPILLIKAGRSAAGAKAASSHTGSLAGSDNAASALLTQTGIQRMESIDELFAAAQAFEYAKPSIGNRVAIYSNAGGYGVMAGDEVELVKERGLELASLSAETEEALKDFMPPAASRRNPVDTTATVPADNLDRFKAGLLRVLEDPNVDSCMICVVPVMGLEESDIAAVASEAQKISGKPVVAMISGGDIAYQDIREELEKRSIPPAPVYGSIEDAIFALGALEKHRRWKASVEQSADRFPDVSPERVREIFHAARAEGRNLLTTTESLAVLEAYGIKTPGHALTHDVEEAVEAAAEIGYPVAIKLSSKKKEFSHKTDVGGVILDIRDEAQLRNAFESLSTSLRNHGVGEFEQGEGIMVQQFLPKGREVIMGVSDDPQFGKLLMLGLGGIYVEVFKDVQFRLAPVTSADVEAMLDGLKSKKILTGVRGKPGVDLDAVKDVALRLSQLVTDFPELQEIDINPFMALPKTDQDGKCGNAVDSRMILGE